MTKKRYLVFCRASDHSLHKEWLSPQEGRNFDLFIEYYGDQPNLYINDCEYYSHYKGGSKWNRLSALIKEQSDLFFSYDAIMMADDDVSMNSTIINRAFDIFTSYDLLLAQPALSPDSFYSHGITLQQQNYILRYSNYVEGMIPIFSKQALHQCWPTFEKSVTGWGLDQVWFKVLGEPKDKIAIIDEAPAKHTRELFHGDLYKTTNANPWQELDSIPKEYGLDYFHPYELGGITSSIKWDKDSNCYLTIVNKRFYGGV